MTLCDLEEISFFRDRDFEKQRKRQRDYSTKDSFKVEEPGLNQVGTQQSSILSK